MTRLRPVQCLAAACIAALGLTTSSVLAQSISYGGPGQNVGQAPGESSKPAGAGGTATPYKNERYEEDYSYLAHAPKTDFFDPVKYIPLGFDDGYITLGGQARDRYENYNHNNWGAGPQDKDGYNLARLFLDVDVHLGQNVRVFAEGRGVWEDGRLGGPRGRDRDEVDLQQGFVDFMLPIDHDSKLTARVGRQELQFGAERLIGPADWSNARKNFDGVRVTYRMHNNQLDAFLTRPVEVDRYEFDDAVNTQVFAGLYDTLLLPDLIAHANTKLEVYGLWVEKKNVSMGLDGTGRERRWTAGSRFTTNPKPWDLDIEGDYQGGSFKDEDIQAYSLAVDAGYTFDQVALRPRAFVGFDIASGDRSAGGRLQTFDQLFPSAHTFFGYMDFIGRQNIIDLHPGVDVTFCENHRWAQKVTGRAEYHQFWRQSDSDNVYDTSGGVIRGHGTTGSRNIGSEIDLLLRWQVDRHLSTYIGYSHFFHGTFLEDTGAHKDVDFTYAAVTYTF